MARKTLIQVRRDTAANWTSANPTLAAGEVGFETDTGKFKIGDGSTAWASLTYFIPGVGAGGSTIATDTLWDTKGDIAAATGADTAVKLAAGANGKLLVAASGETTGLKWDSGYLGGLELVYRYTVTGSDKASIDTGSDTPDAGSNDWTNGDLLEIFLTGRTDEAVVSSVVALTLNNDTGSNYDRESFSFAGTGSLASSNALAGTSFGLSLPGTSVAANFQGLCMLRAPNYAGTTFYKVLDGWQAKNDTTAANNTFQNAMFTYRSTSAVTRLKVIPATAAKKFKVGTQLLIYKRRSS